MSGNISHDELQAKIIDLMFDAMNGDFGWIGADLIGQQLSIASDRVTLAATRLVREGHLHARYNTRAGAKYQITEKAYLEVEEWRQRNAEIQQQAVSDPLQSIESRLVPAADRLVTFDDNQRDLEQVVEAIDDARGVIQSSNTLDVQLRDDTSLSLNTWKNLVVKSKRFAVGAFKYLVWDRLKAVIEGGIEDVYRLALTALLITIGTIIVGLL